MMIGGEKGREIERWSDDERRGWAQTILRDVFGPDVPEPVEVGCTTWNDDPFALGAYTYIPVGATPDDLETLAESVGARLLFAGEATYRPHWGCTHGAYASGLREAARITGDASILPNRIFTENRRWRAMLLRATRFFNTLGAALSEQEVE